MWLAIDPSLRNTGWAVMDEEAVYKVGIITTKRDKNYPLYQDNAYCIMDIAAGLDEATEHLSDLGGGPIHSEAKGGSKSAKANAAMAMAQSAVASAAFFKGKGLMLMSPQKVKRVVCGDKSASKDDIRLAVIRLYPGIEEMLERNELSAKKYSEHIYDAIAIGWAIHQTKGSK